jgi:hypothetical protein
VGHYSAATYFDQEQSGKWISGSAWVDVEKLKVDGPVYLTYGALFMKFSDVSLSPMFVHIRTTQEQAAIDDAARQAILNELKTRKLTISCYSGSKKKVVTGDPPKCPTGYKTGMESYKTFSAYSVCKLYKKYGTSDYAKLSNGGRTLEVLWHDYYEVPYSISEYDFTCLLNKLGVSATNRLKIDRTREIDGLLEAKQGNLKFLWSYSLRGGLFLRATYLD